MSSLTWTIIKQLFRIQIQVSCSSRCHCRPTLQYPFRGHRRWGSSGRMGDNSPNVGKVTGTSHLERTSDKPRDPDIHEVTVTQMSNLSPTVKQIVLSVPANGENGVTPRPFKFKAGQWLDLFVPGISKIGGFTITSSPERLHETGSLVLAIQYSEVQPAFWVHTECQIGVSVSIRIGGDFYFDSEDRDVKALLLVGGGVGINPLSSIIQHIHGSNKATKRPIPVTLLYSAKTQEELIFRGEFDSLTTKSGETLTCRYFVTGSSYKGLTTETVQKGRITKDHLQRALDLLLSHKGVTQDEVKVYICGPPPMIANIEEICKVLNLKNVATEKWW